MCEACLRESLSKIKDSTKPKFVACVNGSIISFSPFINKMNSSGELDS